MRHRGESAETRGRERVMLEYFSKYLGMSYQQCPSNSGKYRIDGWLFDEWKTVRAWCECKWYPDGKQAFCGINPPKYLELVELGREFGVDSYFIFREQGRLGYIKVFEKVWSPINPSVTICGGTPDHRPANDDDIEPMVMLPKDEIVWFLEK